MTAADKTRARRDLTPAQASLLSEALIYLARDLRPITVRDLYYQAVIFAAGTRRCCQYLP